MSQVRTREEEMKEKKIKVEAETESSMKGKSNMSNTEATSETSKETSKEASEIQKLDYIHVRARRGQATDRHSLAERVQKKFFIYNSCDTRNKISSRVFEWIFIYRREEKRSARR